MYRPEVITTPIFLSRSLSFSYDIIINVFSTDATKDRGSSSRPTRDDVHLRDRSAREFIHKCPRASCTDRGSPLRRYKGYRLFEVDPLPETGQRRYFPPVLLFPVRHVKTIIIIKVGIIYIQILYIYIPIHDFSGTCSFQSTQKYTFIFTITIIIINGYSLPLSHGPFFYIFRRVKRCTTW